MSSAAPFRPATTFRFATRRSQTLTRCVRHLPRARCRPQSFLAQKVCRPRHLFLALPLIVFSLQSEPKDAGDKSYKQFTSYVEYKAAEDAGKTGVRPAAWYLPPLGAELSTDAWAATAGMAPGDPIFPAGNQALPPAVCREPRASPAHALPAHLVSRRATARLSRSPQYVSQLARAAMSRSWPPSGAGGAPWMQSQSFPEPPHN